MNIFMFKLWPLWNSNKNKNNIILFQFSLVTFSYTNYANYIFHIPVCEQIFSQMMQINKTYYVNTPANDDSSPCNTHSQQLQHIMLYQSISHSQQLQHIMLYQSISHSQQLQHMMLYQSLTVNNYNTWCYINLSQSTTTTHDVISISHSQQLQHMMLYQSPTVNNYNTWWYINQSPTVNNYNT